MGDTLGSKAIILNLSNELSQMILNGVLHHTRGLSIGNSQRDPCTGSTRPGRRLWLTLAILLLSSICLGQSLELRNQYLVARFAPSGLSSVQQVGAEPVRIRSDGFRFSVGSAKLSSVGMKPSVRSE